MKRNISRLEMFEEITSLVDVCAVAYVILDNRDNWRNIMETTLIDESELQRAFDQLEKFFGSENDK